jgi:hypothetical protein
MQFEVYCCSQAVRIDIMPLTCVLQGNTETSLKYAMVTFFQSSHTCHLWLFSHITECYITSAGGTALLNNTRVDLCTKIMLQTLNVLSLSYPQRVPSISHIIITHPCLIIWQLVHKCFLLSFEQLISVWLYGNFSIKCILLNKQFLNPICSACSITIQIWLEIYNS